MKCLNLEKDNPSVGHQAAFLASATLGIPDMASLPAFQGDRPSPHVGWYQPVSTGDTGPRHS